MGYDTILNRVFIKVDEERFIPYVNSKSSNTFESTRINGRTYDKAIQTNYALTFGATRTVTTIKEIEEYLEKTVHEKLEYHQRSAYSSEEEKTEKYVRENLGWLMVFFVGTRKYMSQKQMLTWFKSGKENAYTIDELKAKFNTSFSMINRDTKEVIYIDSSEELNLFLDREDANSFYFNILQYDYLYKCIGRENKRIAEQNKIGKPQKPKKVVDHYFVVNSNKGYLFKRKRSLYTTWSQNTALPFKTEKQAQMFIDKVNKRYTIGGMVIEKIEESTTF